MHYGVQYLATRNSAASPSASTETAILLLDNDTAGNTTKLIKYLSVSAKGLAEGEHSSVYVHLCLVPNGSSVVPAQISEFDLTDSESIIREPSSLPSSTALLYAVFLTDYENLWQIQFAEDESLEVLDGESIYISVESTVSNIEYQAVIGWED